MIKTSCSSVRLGSLLTLGVSLGIALVSGGCHSYKDLGIQSVRSNSADLQACMAELAGRNPSAKGSMELKLEVTPAGKVHRMGYGKDELNDPEFRNCLQQRVANWSMTPPPSGKIEQFSYDFTIKGK
jgi:hypothetical protein